MKEAGLGRVKKLIWDEVSINVSAGPAGLTPTELLVIEQEDKCFIRDSKLSLDVAAIEEGHATYFQHLGNECPGPEKGIWAVHHLTTRQDSKS